MARSNCIIFALLLYLRCRRQGWEAYLMVRPSRLACGPHMLVGRPRSDGRVAVVSYVPKVPVERGVPPLLFEGRVRWGD